jgi:hypothetical protein
MHGLAGATRMERLSGEEGNKDDEALRVTIFEDAQIEVSPLVDDFRISHGI